MKAKVIATGEIVDVDWHDHDGISVIYKEYSTSSARTFRRSELVFINDSEEPTKEIDWEQRRFELVKAAMQGILSNQCSWEMAAEDVATEVTRCADAVIEKLKEE